MRGRGRTCRAAPIPGDGVSAQVADALGLDLDVPKILALLSGAAFIGTTRAVTAHFAAGELAVNAYRRLAVRNSRRMRSGPLSMPTAGEGIDVMRATSRAPSTPAGTGARCRAWCRRHGRGSPPGNSGRRTERGILKQAGLDRRNS